MYLHDPTMLRLGQLNIWLLTTVAFLFSLVSLFLYPGYEIGQDDQRYFLPPILQNMQPELFERDFLMSASQSEATVFDEIVAIAALHQPDNIPMILFWGTFLARTILFLGISLLAFSFTQNLFFAALSPVFFLIGHHEFVTNAMPPKFWLFSFGMELHPRSFTIPMSVLAMGLFFLERHALTWVVLAIGLLIHPLSIIPVIISIGGYTFLVRILLNREYKYALWYLFPIASMIVLILLVGNGSAMDNSLLQKADPRWLAFSKEQTPWMFFGDYLHQTLQLGVFLPLLLFFLITTTNNRVAPAIVGKLMIICMILASLAIVSIFTFDQLGLVFFGQFQLHRSFHLLTIILPLAVLGTAVLELSQREASLLRRVTFATLFLSVCLGGEYFLLPLSLLTLFVALYFSAQQYFHNSLLLLSSYVFFAVVCIIKTIISHPVAQQQFALLRDFFVALLIDPILSFGLLTLWAVPVFATAVALILILMNWNRQIIKMSHKLIFYTTCGVFALSILFGFHSQYSVYTNPFRLDSDAAYWVQSNIPKNALIFVSLGSENFGKDIRNYLGMSVFFTEFGRSQGTFNRNYAFEWEYRRKLQQNPLQHQAEFVNYGIDYFVFRNSEERFSDLPIVFQDDEYVILANGN